MFSAMLSALSGMLGFSKGLDVISNNVANMNTPGFKASELQFRDLYYRYGLTDGNGGFDQIGEGVDTGSTRIQFQQGDLHDTGNGLDVAIDGNGFFVVRKDGQTFYTRNGQFEFDQQGFLVEKSSGARVAASDNGRLVDISISGLRVNPPKPTSEITLAGTLSSTGTTHQINNVTVVDALGNTRTLTLNFTKTNQATLDSSKLATTDIISSFPLDASRLLTTRTISTTTDEPLDSAQLSTTKTVTHVVDVAPFYAVRQGDTFESIALALYGHPEAAVALAEALGNPELNAGRELTGFPAGLTVGDQTFDLNGSALSTTHTVSETISVPPFYTVKAGDTFDSVAAVLYGTSDLGSELAAALGFPPLVEGSELTGFPETLALTTTTTEAAPPFYRVSETDTPQSIATLLYGSADAADDMLAALGNPVITPATELTGFPATLSLTTPITVSAAPHYIVQSGDTWDSIAVLLYGGRLGAELQAALGNSALDPGTRLTNFPAALTVASSNGGANRWAVEVKEGDVRLGIGEVRYNGAGALIDGFNTFDFNLTREGVDTTTVTLNFGPVGDTSSGSNGFSIGSTSNLRVDTQNGFEAGSLASSAFDEQGRLTLSYSNGQTTTQGRLAVASFADPQALTLTGGNLFVSSIGQDAVIAAAQDQGMGKIVPKKIELSNVQLTEQFSDIVVIQRGFQASSQIISVANEMTQQLLDLHARR